MAAFVSTRIELLRRNWGELAKAFAPLVFGSVAFPIALWAIHGPSVILGLILLTVAELSAIAGAALGFAAFRANERQVPVRGRVEAGEGGLVFRGKRLAERRALRGGFFIPSEDGAPLVRLVQRFPRAPLTLQVPDEPTGRALLSALGLDAAQTIATMKLASLLRSAPHAAAGDLACALAIVPGLPLTLAIFPGAVTVALAFLVTAWILLHFVAASVHVGADGVLVSWAWYRRFVRFEDLVEVRHYLELQRAGIVLAVRGGGEVKLPLHDVFTVEKARQDLTMIAKRIEQAAEVYRRAQADRAVALPARGGRAAGEWIRSLRVLGSGANADHRTAPVERDTLFRIAEDPGSDPSRRVSAAVALGGTLDEPGRARLRVAASTTASPELRGALELAADEAASDEALAAAMEGVAGPSRA